jgi:membrane protein DedA with SNARE-associated domain/membrane-associated phospholipid phosphatase
MRIPETRRGRGVAIGLVVLGVIAFWVVVNRVIPHEDLQQLLEDISNALGSWTYLLVGAFAFLETGAFVGLVVPGETVMLLGGAVAGQHAINLYLLLGIAWFSAWAGDTTSFFIGRRLGRGFVLERGPAVGISHKRFAQVESYFDRHGGKTILIGRFVSLVRALAPFVAGSSGMRYRGFVPYSILGTGLWSAAHILIGYFASRSIDTAAKYAGRGAFLLGTLIVVVVGTVLAVRFLRVPGNRQRAVEWMEARRPTRWLVVVGRRIQPQARFLWARLTPGGTFGLEVTSLLAALAVGLFVLIAYTVVIGGDPDPTPGDQMALDVAESIQAGWLTSIAKLFSDLGSAGVVLPLAAASALALAIARRWVELSVLVVGTLLVVLGVPDLKDAVDRPRPSDGLIDVSGSSFPSGHAAYSVFYLWAAVTIAVRLRPGMARATALIVAGIALAALIGLSRVYLRVHYLSDVNAGWALGVSAYTLCATVVLVGSQLRHAQLRQNGRPVSSQPSDPGAGGEDRT